MLSLKALLLVSVLAAPNPASRLKQVGAELEAARHTRDLIAQKLEAREKDLHVRVRALYKLTAFGTLPLWVDDGARDDFQHRRAAGTRVLVRDLEERAQLRAELAAAEADVVRLSAENGRAATEATPTPARGSFTRPVTKDIAAPFGIYVDDASTTTTKGRVSRHGVELEPVPAGTPVVAPEEGRVLYAGPIRGLGEGVVLDHGAGIVTVIGNLAGVQVRRDDVVARATPVGATAAGTRVYLEVRLAGRPIDPAPFLRAIP
jgi:septal ring factor EnvC (AmiA/AmiB activator)